MTTLVIMLASIWNPRRVLTYKYMIVSVNSQESVSVTSSLTWCRSLWMPLRMSSWIITVDSSSLDISVSLPWKQSWVYLLNHAINNSS